jgi:hypothetical protein
MIPGNMVPGSELRFTLFQATLGRRTGLPASHAGVADVSSTHGQLSAMAWIEAIIESIVGWRQTEGDPLTISKLGIPLSRHVNAVITLARNSLQNPFFKDLRYQNP